jgi:16S rRNA (adenine1518-N6/adenine1519-N6)-dimethyltransferase
VARLGADGWTLHRGSALDFDYLSIGTPLHVVGNLPYNVGALIIKRTLLYGSDVASCTFMVQREVAERIAAKPGSRRNGFLSIFCQYFGSPKILFHVPAGAFFPRPNVDSSVFRLGVEPSLVFRLPREQWEAFFSFVDRGFSMRRKMLVNVLGHNGDRERYRAAMQSAGLDDTARPEQLGITEWLNLYTEVCSLL